MKTFKRSVKRKRTCNDDDKEEQELVIVDEVTVPLTLGSLDGTCSALFLMFVECETDKSYNNVTKDLGTTLTLYKKIGHHVSSKQRQDVGMRLL